MVAEAGEEGRGDGLEADVFECAVVVISLRYALCKLFSSRRTSSTRTSADHIQSPEARTSQCSLGDSYSHFWTQNSM